MGIKQLYIDKLRKLPNKYGDISVMHARIKCVIVTCDFWSMFEN